MQTSPYFTMPTTKSANATLDPRALQMQQYAQQQQQQHPQQMLQQSQQPHQAQQVGMLQQMQGVQNGQMHHLFQMQPQGTSMATTRAIAQPKMNKKPKVSGSASSSDDDLEIEEEEPEQKPAAITIAKPSDERGKLLWEVVDAVWTPRNKPAAPEKIRSAISFIGTAVRNLRDKWKATNDQLKQAELPDSKSKSLTEGLKVIVSSYRETMESLAGRVARFGHPSILSRYVFHHNPPFTHTLYNICSFMNHATGRMVYVVNTTVKPVAMCSAKRISPKSMVALTIFVLGARSWLWKCIDSANVIFRYQIQCII